MADAYFNEFDPNAVRWLRQLQADGQIASGTVDDRSIRNVEAKDVAGYRTCHFFAGIGGWPYVVRLRGYGNAINPWTAAKFIRAYLATGGGTSE